MEVALEVAGHFLECIVDMTYQGLGRLEKSKALSTVFKHCSITLQNTPSGIRQQCDAPTVVTVTGGFPFLAIS